MALSEDNIIKQFFAPLTAGEPGAFDLTDDAALIAPSPGEKWVVTTDTLVAETHFFPDDLPEDIATKALAVNLSDLAAKGSAPKYYLLSLALPKSEHQHDASWLSAFQNGLKDMQTKHGCVLIGGDTVATNGPLTVTIAAIGGIPSGGRMVKRSGAKPGDKVFVTGTIGNAVLGLQLRQDDKINQQWNIQEEELTFLRTAYSSPKPQTSAAVAVRDYASAAMDISDGLVGDFRKLCAASHVGANIDGRKIPLSDPAQTIINKDESWFVRLITGGDDYQILATVAPENTEAFLQACQQVNVPVKEIGTIEPSASGVMFSDQNGKEIFAVQGSYTHF